ncbi:hypothetical protein M5689_003612 [Euphorbia peplus]|nr:hypothetical protein M5689_003612 [Euphorbia peplus]
MSVPSRKGIVRATRDWPKGCGPNRSETSSFCAPHRFCVSSSLEDDQGFSLYFVVPESDRKPSLEGSNEVEIVRSKVGCTQCLCCKGRGGDNQDLSPEDSEVRRLCVAKVLRDEAERVENSTKIPLAR